MQRLEDRLKQADHTPLVCLHCAFSSSTYAHHKHQHYAQAKNGEFAGLLHGLTLLVAHCAHRRMTVFTHQGASMEVQLIHVSTYMLSASQVMSLLWTYNMISCTVEHAVPMYRMLLLRMQSRSVFAVYLTSHASPNSSCRLVLQPQPGNKATTNLAVSGCPCFGLLWC